MTMKTNLMTIMFIIILTLTMKQYCEQHGGAVSFMEAESEIVKEDGGGRAKNERTQQVEVENEILLQSGVSCYCEGPPLSCCSCVTSRDLRAGCHPMTTRVPTTCT